MHFSYTRKSLTLSSLFFIIDQDNCIEGLIIIQLSEMDYGGVQRVHIQKYVY